MINAHLSNTNACSGEASGYIDSNEAMIISVRVITTMIRNHSKRNDYVHNAELAELEARF